MAKFERERKFLLSEESGDLYKKMSVSSIRIVQGYLSKRKEATVRIRIAGDNAWLTIKGITTGDVREEYEYEVPMADAECMLKMCEGTLIEKIRWIIPWKGYTYEVDEFEGSLSGLVLCEVEFSEEGAILELPPFIGKEVTGDSKYYNSHLSTYKSQ